MSGISDKFTFGDGVKVIVGKGKWHLISICLNKQMLETDYILDCPHHENCHLFTGYLYKLKWLYCFNTSLLGNRYNWSFFPFIVQEIKL